MPSPACDPSAHSRACSISADTLSIVVLPQPPACAAGVESWACAFIARRSPFRHHNLSRPARCSIDFCLLTAAVHADGENERAEAKTTRLPFKEGQLSPPFVSLDRADLKAGLDCPAMLLLPAVTASRGAGECSCLASCWSTCAASRLASPASAPCTRLHTMPHVDIPGDVSVYYEFNTRSGAHKPSLLLVAPSWTNATFLEPYVEAFRDDFSVCCVELRGHGRTRGGVRPTYDYFCAAADLGA